MYQPLVQLKSGGYLVINPTEALVSIDINSGRSTREHNIEQTAFATNLEAAAEIARQLRLRDMAGLVVIDFIDMEQSSHVRKVEKAMKDALKNDRARIQVGRISSFGLMEMSRQRLRTGVLEASTKPCPHCEGSGLMRTASSSGLSALRMIEDEAARGRGTAILLRAGREAAIYLLNRKRAELADIEQRYGVSSRSSIDEAFEGAKMSVESSGPRPERPRTAGRRPLPSRRRTRRNSPTRSTKRMKTRPRKHRLAASADGATAAPVSVPSGPASGPSEPRPKAERRAQAPPPPPWRPRTAPAATGRCRPRTSRAKPRSSRQARLSRSPKRSTAASRSRSQDEAGEAGEGRTPPPPRGRSRRRLPRRLPRSSRQARRWPSGRSTRSRRSRDRNAAEPQPKKRTRRKKGRRARGRPVAEEVAAGRARAPATRQKSRQRGRQAASGARARRRAASAEPEPATGSAGRGLARRRRQRSGGRRRATGSFGVAAGGSARSGDASMPRSGRQCDRRRHDNLRFPAFRGC